MHAYNYRKIPKRTLLSLIVILITILFIHGSSPAEEDIKGIKKDLKSGDWQTRLSALKKLENYKDRDEAVELLLQVAGTRSEYWPVQIKAITLLGESRDSRSIELLLSIFNDTFQNWECPSIKSHAALALGNFNGNRKIVDALIEGLNDRELLTREASIKSLGKIGDTKAVPYLISLLHDRSSAIRLSAIKALEEIGDARAVSQIQDVANTDDDEEVKNIAREALNNFDQNAYQN